jgi:adenylyltransferase/sulfurtransferase
MIFRKDQVQRYMRHILLPEVGGEGQARLLRAKVLVIGAGGLGSPVIYYLAAAGVGTIGVADDDVVDLSNLQRQIIHTVAAVGTPKTHSAATAVAALNTDVQVIAHPAVQPDNIMDTIAGYDIVLDCSDNFTTRFLVNDAVHLQEKTLISAAVSKFEGQLYTFKTYLGGPCYRCLFPEPPSEFVANCAETGILGAVVGVMGTMQATECLKEILGLGQSMAGSLLIWDALNTATRKITLPKDTSCKLCGADSTWKDLSHLGAAPACALSSAGE